MKKSNLVEKVYEAHGGLSRNEAAQIVDLFFDEIKKAIINDKVVRLKGFGIFEVVKRKTKRARHPKSRELIEIPSRKIIKFRISKSVWGTKNASD